MAFAAACGTEASVESKPDAAATDAAAADADVGPGADQAAGVDDAGDAPTAADAAQDAEPTGDAAGATDGATADASPLPACGTVTDCPLAPACKAWACQKGACVPQDRPDGSACDDKDSCTGGETCLAGQCQGGALKECDDANECTKDSCAPAAGCIHLAVAASTACDDSDACTVGDACQAGQCVPGLNTCQCKNHLDCGKFEDGNTCNGTLFCDTAQQPHVCKVNPASIVQCPSDQDGPCAKNTCNPTTGQCKLLAASGGTPCSDGEACTQGDACLDGLCTPGTYVCACKQDSDCAAVENGDKCDGTLFCNKATSQCEVNPLTVVTCQTVDDTACTKNLCNPKEGKCHLVPVSEGKVCDDGNPCTPNETCDKGQCQAMTNTCQCQKDSDCAVKEDGNLCNGTLYCEVKSGTCLVNPATVVTCGDGGATQCLQNVCTPATGKCGLSGTGLQGQTCDDGNPCTPNEACNSGQCQAATNLCECQKDLDCQGKEDGDLCNGTLYCDLKAFKCVVNPATVIACPTAFDTPCEAMRCDKKSGKCLMTPMKQGNQCVEEGSCSGGGWCDLGTCQAGENTCQCITDADCKVHEDGDLCNGTLYCDKTGNQPGCKVNPATVVTCPKVSGAGSCQQNLCQPSSGKCQIVVVPGACDDGNACTTKDHCQSGTCAGVTSPCSDGDACTIDSCLPAAGCLALPQAASVCDDGNPCTGDGCDALLGCTHLATGASLTCDDKDPCTLADTCKDGSCGGKPKPCDDGNPCTNDSCAAGKGCTSLPNTLPCTDGNPCTTQDVCKGGGCSGGPALACDDGSVCTTDGCDPKTGACTHTDTGAQLCADGNSCTDDTCYPLGCKHVSNLGKCDDTDPCTTGDACSGGKCVTTGALSCSDGQACTDDACDPKQGCVFAFNTAACDDGIGCTKADVCKDGKCKGVLDCDDKNACTADSCDVTTGKCQNEPTGAPCDDGDACTAESLCKASTCTPTKAVVCGDGNDCTDDACDKTKGCHFPFNQAPCQSGQCTGEDKCDQGTCKASGKPAYFSKLYGSLTAGRDEYVMDLVPTADGAIGVGWSRQSNTITNSRSVIWRWGTAGTAQLTVEPNNDLPGSYLNGVVAVGDGTYLATGYANEGSDYQVLAQRFDGTGKTLWRKTMGTALDDYGEEIVAVPGKPDEFVICGFGSSCQSGCNEDAIVLRIDGKGELLGSATWGNGNSLHQRVYGCAFTGTGLLVTAGENDEIGPGALGQADAEVLFWSYPELKVIKSERLGSASYDQFLAAATGSDGSVFLVGYFGASGGHRAVARYDAKGNKLWAKALQTSTGSVARGVHPMPDGGAVLTGKYLSSELFMQRIDSAGADVALKTVATPVQGQPVDAWAVTRDAHGAIWVGGRTYGTTASDGWLVRADPWLTPQCTAGCGALTWSACDDENACTTDLCSGGCQAVPHTLPCDDGNACTSGDVCAQSKCAGTAFLCDDKDACTSDSCDPTKGCVHAAYPDGFVCAAGKSCKSGVCQ